MHRLTYYGLALGLAGGFLLASAASAVAQMGGGGGGMAGGLTGGLGSSGLGSGLGGPGFTGGSGMSGGSGFTGGAGMTGGTSFSGGTGFSGGGITGARTGLGMAGTSYGGTALWGQYLASPYAMGLQGGVRQIQHPFSETLRFGTPLYSNTGTGSTGMSGSATLGTNNRGGFGSSIGIRRAPAYTVELGFGVAPPSTGPLQARADLQDILARSTRSGKLNSGDTIQVGMAGPVVVLRGTVLNDHDRRLAEGLLRLSPGVHDVRNELVIQGTTASASASRP